MDFRFLALLVIFTTTVIFPAYAQEEKAEESAPVVQIGKDGLIFKSADQKFSFRIGGYIHADSRFFLSDDAELGIDGFLLQRARVIVEGTFYKSLTFRFMPDFGQGNSVIQDAYLEWNQYPQAKVRFGKYKGPIGLERLHSATALLFIQRGAPTNLVPNRDLGIMLTGDLKDSLIHYAIAVMNGVPDGGSADLDTADGKDGIARIFINPNAKADFLGGAGFGIGASYGDQTRTIPSYRTPGLLTFFSYNTDSTADGALYRVAPQFHFYNGPVTVIGEYVLSSQEVAMLTSSGTIKNTAWQLAGAILLTGEKATPKLIEPLNSFDPSEHNWGAFQIAFRYSELNVDEDAFSLGFADPAKSAQRAREFAVGLNWYWNKNAKLVFNYERTDFDGGAVSGDRETENLFLTRFQIAF